ncbi:MAG: hypothetical protein AAB281_00235, partial [Actinomycetota bacterium]
SSYTRQANALSGSDWTVVKTAVDGYFNGSQSGTTDDGEAGYTVDRDDLKGWIDSDGDMSPTGTTSTTGTVTGVLDEGDDAINAPVLVDNLYDTVNVIPGTSVRCYYSHGASTTTACMGTDRVAEVKERVDAHQEAGFSTDVVLYCQTGRTEAPTTGGFGFIANASGGLATDTTLTPEVKGLLWGRQGWQDVSTFPSTGTRTSGTVAAPSTIYTYTDSAAPDCSAESTDAGRVRCAAAWALDIGAGNVSNGVTPAAGNYFPTTGGGQGDVIDIRNPSTSTTLITTNPATFQIPYTQVFNTGLPYIGTRTSTTKNVFVSRSSIVGGSAAMGARMLGYYATFLREGASAWNSSWAGTWSAQGTDYPLQTAAGTVNSGIDQTNPVNSGINEQSITATSAVIERDASEAASMKVQYDTDGSAPWANTENNTVLNQTNKQVTLSGLSEYTTYYYRVCSYDGQANSDCDTTDDSAVTLSFTTSDVT